MQKIRLTDYDKSVLLIVSLLAMLVGGGASVLHLLNLISDRIAVILELMALSWWFGAVMTFGYERVKNEYHANAGKNKYK